FPVLGNLHVEGMTRAELAGFIKGELIGKNLIKDPTVTVEFLNTGISVLGEVNAPGRYVLNRDELTVLDALAMAGDLKIQGRRDNIRVMRKEGDKTKVYMLDLTSGKNIYNNPGFYLQQDDMVYVEPNDYRKRETTVNGNTSLSASFWISVVSVLTSVAVLVVNLVKK
ncbi:MAG: polysaccharide biosynthesis/export family protein, partial [Muribaculaceae bacterium]|nr:polysaccharide biosynthesis/export family protein [Muribaculaceae bacterium]